MQVTPNFALEEFELEGKMPDVCVPAFTFLCHLVLEPIRTNFKTPMRITSGYRPLADNTLIHGDPHSEHMATKDYCAADWEMEIYVKNMRPVFDWIRRNNNIPFHIVTLEHGKNGRDIIHTSWNRFATTREAKEGAENNLSKYTNWPVGIIGMMSA